MTQPDDQTLATPAADGAADKLDDTAVADFLRRHPDFLNRHPEILDDLVPPSRWSGDGVVDMQQFMINRNRSEMDALRDCAQDVIETSRSNMSTQTRAHAAVLALLGARQWPDIIHVVSHDWPLLLDVDVVAMVFEPPAGPDPRLVGGELRSLAPGDIDRFLGAEQDVRLMREVQDDGTLFGSGAGLVRSAALIRMRPGPSLPPGLLALGARGATFHPGQGTELLGFLARVLEVYITRSMDEAEGGEDGGGD